MKMRAAVAGAAGKPLKTMEIELDGPKAGEVLTSKRARQPPYSALAVSASMSFKACGLRAPT